MEFILQLLKKDSVRRILILSCLGVILYLLRSMLNLFLLTFIFTYFMYRIQNFLVKRLRNVVRIKQRVIIIGLYLTLAGLVIFAGYRLIPIVIQQSGVAIDQAYDFYNKPHDGPVYDFIKPLIDDIDISGYTGKGVNFVINSAKIVSTVGLDIFLALILSLFFLLEKNRIIRFSQGFKTSKISFVYNEIEYFGKKFLNSFGKVIEAQVLIALINSILSVIALAILRMPQLPALGLMIFLLGLIPVAGVFISLVPLSIIAFNIGGGMAGTGVINVIYVLIMVVILHSLEAYFLNPKLMSSKTELPVFYTFIVLIVSEHYFGVWGLIIGIPIFVFILDLLDVKKEGNLKKESSNNKITY